MTKTAEAFRTISEVADELEVPKHVLRFWEGRFPQIRPMKRGGGRRYYRPADMALLRAIRFMLYGEGYTIRGVQRLLKEQGVRAFVDASADAPASTSAPPQAAQSSGAAESGAGDNSQTLLAALRHLSEARRILLAARAV